MGGKGRQKRERERVLSGSCKAEVFQRAKDGKLKEGTETLDRTGENYNTSANCGKGATGISRVVQRGHVV